MIRKPQGTWQRESPVVTTTRAVATGIATGTGKVVKAGRYGLRGLAMCWFAAMLALAALAAGASGEHWAVLIGICAIAAFIGWNGFRQLGKARRVVGPGDAPSASAHGQPIDASRSGTTIYYARGRLIGSAILWAVLSMVAMMTVIGFLALPMFIALSIASIAKLRGDRIALHFDDRLLTVATLFRRRAVDWTDVSAVRVTRRGFALYGLILVGRIDRLVIHAGGSKLRVSPSLLELDGRTLHGLAAELETARQGNAWQMPAERSRSASRGRTSAAALPDYPPSDAPFDPDAIMARYLARKAEAEQGAAAVELAAVELPEVGRALVRRQFGRKVA